MGCVYVITFKTLLGQGQDFSDFFLCINISSTNQLHVQYFSSLWKTTFIIDIIEYYWFIQQTNTKRVDHNIAISLNDPHNMAFALKSLFLGRLISHKQIEKCFLGITFPT